MEKINVTISDIELTVNYTSEEPDFLVGDNGYIRIYEVFHNNEDISQLISNRCEELIIDEIRKELSW